MYDTIFVFGSNLAGRHGAGAALFAVNYHGAKYGVPFGRQGNAFAIPTKDANFNTLPLDHIRQFVKEFIEYAKEHLELSFKVTKIGCGLAGLKEVDIAPMFKDAPDNCMLPGGWHGSTNPW